MRLDLLMEKQKKTEFSSNFFVLWGGIYECVLVRATLFLLFCKKYTYIFQTTEKVFSFISLCAFLSLFTQHSRRFCLYLHRRPPLLHVSYQNNTKANKAEIKGMSKVLRTHFLGQK